MLTRTCELAIRAMLYLAVSRREEPVSPNQMAGVLRCSPTYLGKTLRALVKAGLLTSLRGVRGGVVLTRAPETITLLQIVEASQGLITANYCSDDGRPGDICAFHEAMQQLHAACVGVLRQWTLADLLRSPARSPRPGLPPCKMYFEIVPR